MLLCVKSNFYFTYCGSRVQTPLVMIFCTNHLQELVATIASHSFNNKPLRQTSILGINAPMTASDYMHSRSTENVLGE